MGAEDDADQDLVPKLITKLVIPFAIDYLSFEWNPMAGLSTRATLALLQDLRLHIGLVPSPSSGSGSGSGGADSPIQKLLDALRERWQRAIQSLSAALPPSAKSTSSSSSSSQTPKVLEEQQRARLRFFWRAIKLLRRMCAFFHLASPPPALLSSTTSFAYTSPGDPAPAWTSSAASAESAGASDPDQQRLNGVLHPLLSGLVQDLLAPFLAHQLDYKGGLPGLRPLCDDLSIPTTPATPTPMDATLERESHLFHCLRLTAAVLDALPPRVLALTWTPAAPVALTKLAGVAQKLCAQCKFFVAQQQQQQQQDSSSSSATSPSPSPSKSSLSVVSQLLDRVFAGLQGK
jgi:hypothetical protein